MPNEPQCYYCSGMKFYGDQIPLKPYASLKAPTLFLGLYFESDYQAFKIHQGKRVVFWNGSDVIRLCQNSKWADIVRKVDATHYCHNTQLKHELEDEGIDSTVKPVFFGYKKDYKVCYKHSETPKVFMCSHPERDAEYGVNMMQEIAADMKDIEFHVYGVRGMGTDNVIFHGQVPEEKMDEEMKGYQGCLRMNKHDGVSQIVLKSEMMGLYPIVSYNSEDIKAELNNLKKNKEAFLTDLSEVIDMDNINSLM